MHWVGGGWFFGMHLLWWLFWVVVIAVLVGVLRPATGSRERETPLQILQRRYAAGELSTEEYEERKGRLEQDASKNP